ncbi:MAG: aldo/keto reductase [Opitutales bacterium]
MRTRPLGKSGIEASIIGVGTWAIGGGGWGGTDERASIEAIHASLDAGINLVDTAPIYGKGLSEEIVGKALKDRRDRAVLATKCGMRWDTDAGEFKFNDGTHDIRLVQSLEGIRTEVERSLKRLQTDVIDLYQTHWQTETTPVEDTMACLLELKAEGKIRAIGASNTDPALLRRYLDAGQLDVIQEMFSMVDRHHCADLFPMAAENGVAVLAYSTMAMGLLTGKMGPDREFAEDDMRASSPRFTRENRARVQGLLEKVQVFADKYELSLPQFVIAWSAEVPGVTHLLCGARNPQQAEENAAAGRVEITSEDYAAVEQLINDAAIKLPHPFLPSDD